MSAVRLVVCLFAVVALAGCGDDDTTPPPTDGGSRTDGGGGVDSGGGDVDGGGGVDSGGGDVDSGGGAGAIGAACADPSECVSPISGVEPQCLDRIGMGGMALPLPDGYCTYECRPGMGDCGADGTCWTFDFGMGPVSFCLDNCATMAECREGYACRRFMAIGMADGESDACIPPPP